MFYMKQLIQLTSIFHVPRETLFKIDFKIETFHVEQSLAISFNIRNLKPETIKNLKQIFYCST